MEDDIIIDCRTVRSGGDFWAAYVAAVPDGAHGFGRNLDALWDAHDGG